LVWDELALLQLDWASIWVKGGARFAASDMRRRGRIDVAAFSSLQAFEEVFERRVLKAMSSL